MSGDADPVAADRGLDAAMAGGSAPESAPPARVMSAPPRAGWLVIDRKSVV